MTAAFETTDCSMPVWRYYALRRTSLGYYLNDVNSFVSGRTLSILSIYLHQRTFELGPRRFRENTLI